MRFGRTPPPVDDQTPIERLVRPLKGFATHDLAGAGFLLGATVLALLWANSPWAAHYHDWLHLRVSLGVGDWALSKTLHHWINDGLMGVFFFVVGLEIKREVLVGELASVRRATLPIAAAIGGMLVPALFYAAVNRGGAGGAGWGIPMATDIAFALGVLSVLGDRVPTGLKVFLTALAIVDDIGAIVVIAVFYTDDLSLASLALAGVGLLAAIAMNRLGVRAPTAYFLIGLVVWLGFLKSGLHATLAAVLMAFTIPAQTRVDGPPFLARMRELLGRLESAGVPTSRTLLAHDQQGLLEEMDDTVSHLTAPLQRLEHALLPLVTFLVMPLFALANAGVSVGSGIGDALGDRIALGVVLGLFVGKPVGIVAFSWLAVKLGLADLPSGTSWRLVHAAGTLAGIGFTMSLFIGGLAFADERLEDVAKVGILVASLLSAVVGLLLLRSAARARAAARA